ncbi:MAG: hypothetical protein ACO1RT_07560 [Planctomycetaceae bacterium]
MTRITNVQALLSRMLRRGQIDSVLLSAFAARLWPLAAGPLTIYLIVAYFSPETQGLYYGFSSILGLQAFFELGVSTLVVSLAGHQAVLMQAEDRAVSERGKRRLAAIFHGMVRWYSFVGGLFFFAAFSLGWWTFSREQASAYWRVPWAMIVPIAATSMWLTPWVALLEGIGNREAVYRYRFYQVTTGSIAVWLTIVAGLGIWSVVAAAAVQLGWLVWFVFGQFGRLFQDLRRTDWLLEPVGWREEIIPAQWRIAVQSAAHFLATQLLTLFVITREGLDYGGRFGMTMAVAVSIQAVSLAWVQTKFSNMSRLAAQRKSDELHRLWTTILRVSTLALILGFIGFAATIAMLSYLLPRFGLRFIEWPNIVILGVALLANHVIANQAYFVLACGRKPLFGPLSTGMLITAIVTWAGAMLAGGTGVVLGYALGLVGFALPLHWVAFAAFRRRIAS